MPTQTVSKGSNLIKEEPRFQDAADGSGAEERRRPASSRFERWLLRKLLTAIGSPPFAVELWDGRIVKPERSEALHVIRLRDRGTLWRLLLRPEYEFAEAYVACRLQTDSDMIDVTRDAFTAWNTRASHPRREQLLAWARWPTRSLRAARKNVHHHYDLGNDFYRLWLDRRLIYTCAYFETEQASLEQAQLAKMDHICRKLCLRPGDRVIEAGCGWGTFALHMARNYGAQVRAYNISREQIAFANEEARRSGLDDRVSFIEDDWRNITGECDVFVSVGMLEHVGPEHYRTLGDIVSRCLPSHGRGLIHSIGLNRQRPLDHWTSARIFPGAQPPTLRQAMQIFETHELSVLDVENLRPHYARTLRHWLDRFEQHSSEVRDMFDEEFVRMWRLYLAASVSAFETGWLQLYQILFAPAENNHMPTTRAYLYSTHLEDLSDLREAEAPS